jgi:hypothetical protein
MTKGRKKSPPFSVKMQENVAEQDKNNLNFLLVNFLAG